MLCQVHRCCTNQAPPYQCSLFSVNSNLSQLGLGVRISCTRLNLGQAFSTQVFNFKEPYGTTNYPRSLGTLQEVLYLSLPCLNIIALICSFLCHFIFYFPCCCLELRLPSYLFYCCCFWFASLVSFSFFCLCISRTCMKIYSGL